MKDIAKYLGYYFVTFGIFIVPYYMVLAWEGLV